MPQQIASLVARQSRTDDDSMSVADQIASMREWAARQNPPVAIGGVYEEPDVSGRRPLEKRHGLKQAVADIEAGRSQIILTAYFDRFVRSVATRAEVVQRVEQAGGRVITLDVGVTSDETAAQWLSGTMLAAIGEFYARSVGEKLRVSKERNVMRGVPPFPRITPAYRRRDDGRLEPDPVNGPLIRQACMMRAGIGYDRKHSWGEIQDFLAANGLRMTDRGVQSTLKSPLLFGELRFGQTVNPNAIERPIIDRAIYRQMHQGRVAPGRRSKSEALLARLGVLRCGTCDSRLVVQSGLSKEKRYTYYVCGDRLCSKQANIRADATDDFLRDRAIELGQGFKGRASAHVELEAARVAAEAAKAKVAQAIRTLVGLEQEPASREVIDELAAERDRAVAEHRRLETIVGPERTVSTVADWNALTLEEKRRVIRATIDRAIVGPRVGPRRNGVDAAERITIEPHPLFCE